MRRSRGRKGRRGASVLDLDVVGATVDRRPEPSPGDVVERDRPRDVAGNVDASRGRDRDGVREIVARLEGTRALAEKRGPRFRRR